MRVFLDANVLISSFSFEGVTRRLVAHLVENHEIIISPQVIDEFRRVSIEKIKVDSTMVDSFILEFITIAEVIGPPFEERYELRDPTDIDILAAAIKGKAEVLVSGDKDLLEFEHSPIRVLTPRACYDRLLHGA